MVDFGRSEDPRVQAQLDRLGHLSVPQGRLGLETIRALMERLGNPHRKLPPVFHVAGTNGKGSVCAFLRAAVSSLRWIMFAIIGTAIAAMTATIVIEIRTSIKEKAGARRTFGF